MKQKTHLKINRDLCGEPVAIEECYSKVRLQTTLEMVLDETGLVHGGFTFSLADHAAMLAVNHPNVVLGSANVKFLKPVVKGDILLAEARLLKSEGKRRVVDVEVTNKIELVFKGEFTCFIPEKHVLKDI
ncbi:MAG: hotdog domain-containing protein [Candidatus Odinarchaeota archaeon]